MVDLLDTLSNKYCICTTFTKFFCSCYFGGCAILRPDQPGGGGRDVARVAVLVYAHTLDVVMVMVEVMVLV